MKYFIVISQLLFAIFVIGQKSDVFIEVSETDIVVGQNITISITSSLNGKIEFEFPSNFQKGYSQMEGMSQEYKNGVSKTVYYKTQNGFFTEKGKYVIGPAVVKSKGKIYKSNRVKVNVKKSDKTIPKSNEFNRKLKTIKTVYGETNVSNQEIYEGEPVNLNAKIYSKYPFSKYGYTPYEVSGKYDDFEIINRSPLALAEEKIEGESFYTLTLDNRVVFPLKSGNFLINPFEFDIVDSRIYRVNSDKKIITVRKLPIKNRPDDFIGLVGEFEFEVALSNNEADVNEVITLQIRIDGSGNLHHAVIPELSLPEELELYADPVEKKDYEITTKGFQGALKYTYPLKVLKKNSTKIPAISISYFNPTEKEYLTYTSASLPINENTDTTDIEMIQNTLPAEKVKEGAPVNQRNEEIETKNANWIWYLIILLLISGLAMFLWIYFKRRGVVDQKSEKLPTSKEIKDLLFGLENQTEPSILLSQMEDCLSQTCSMIIGITFLKVSRNEIFTLLIEKLESSELQRLKELYKQIDVMRFSKETSKLTLNDMKSECRSLILSILSKKP